MHRYDHDMYIMRYVGILRMYISQVNIRVLSTHISIKYSIPSSKNRYIYKVWTIPFPSRCNILVKCFSYDVFIGYIHAKQLI